MCFAATAHSFQGQTIVKPNNLVTDIRTVFEPAQAYVILSRVQSIEQLFILEELRESKFYISNKALNELKNLEAKSMNYNPPTWEQKIAENLNISLLNCRDIMTKFLDIKEDLMLRKSHIICLNETHLSDNDENRECLQLPDYKLKLNSAGIGKGLASYYKEEKFKFDQRKNIQKAQIMKLSSKECDVINIYRSHNAQISDDQTIIQEMSKIIEKRKLTIICGDMNICYIQKRNNILLAFLESIGFQQLVDEATHIQGGHLDLIFSNHTAFSYEIDVKIYSPYYTYRDHDAILLTVKPKEKKTSRVRPIRNSERLNLKRKLNLNPEKLIDIKKQKFID